ncbi:hypothetical protein R5W24_000221 [Gemmata sp. JC717]|uniref:hypothetical protein n=1 Tax=Gemmata algarum TaxID=2975278 RepID=UPI0021BB11C7|nr:hypothetical protein [Gemmata algarum]MDY3551146.1 hypothetical protein [Gemmata algarum]
MNPTPPRSAPPESFGAMLEQALGAVVKISERDDLRAVARAVSHAAWDRFIGSRGPRDNRQEHEWVVLANVLRIAEAERLTLSEKRVAVAFTFTHDSHFIPRISEQEVREARSPEAKDLLETRKEAQRYEHMRFGAVNGRSLLSRLKDPRTDDGPLLTAEEIDRCVQIISTHDAWKLRNPAPPPTDDRLALACVEGDALWPLHPLGVLADLERPNDQGRIKDFNDPQAWRVQTQQSCQTLVEFRAKWIGFPATDFVDGESIFRTQEGGRLYSAWRRYWNLTDLERGA